MLLGTGLGISEEEKLLLVNTCLNSLLEVHTCVCGVCVCVRLCVWCRKLLLVNAYLNSLLEVHTCVCVVCVCAYGGVCGVGNCYL